MAKSITHGIFFDPSKPLVSIAGDLSRSKGDKLFLINAVIGEDEADGEFVVPLASVGALVFEPGADDLENPSLMLYVDPKLVGMDVDDEDGNEIDSLLVESKDEGMTKLGNGLLGGKIYLRNMQGEAMLRKPQVVQINPAYVKEIVVYREGKVSDEQAELLASAWFDTVAMYSPVFD